MRKPTAWILAAGLGLASVTASGADSFYVANTGEDTGTCGSLSSPCQTLQWAIDLASAGDTVRALPGIYFECPSISGKAITIVSDQYDVSGDRSAATIDATGVCDESSGQYNPVVFLGNGSTLRGFTVRNGGGVGVVGVGSVTITKNVITGNLGIPFSVAGGGGIYAYSSVFYSGTDPLTIDDNEITDNQADAGGGVFLDVVGRSDRPVRPVIVRGNSILNNRTLLSISRGSGVFLRTQGIDPGSRTSVTITRNFIEGNSNTAAPTPYNEVSYGGGIWAAAYAYGIQSVQITNNQIRGNSASIGGGIALYTSTDAGQITLDVSGNNSVENNAALGVNGSLGYGGGIFSLSTGYGFENVDIKNNTIRSNTALSEGGGLATWVIPAPEGMQTVTVEKNTISHNTAYIGGGMEAFLFTLDLTGLATGKLIVKDNTISSNQTAVIDGAAGGGMFVQSQAIRSVTPLVSLVVEGNRILDNEAVAAAGGAWLSAYADSSETLPGDPNPRPESPAKAVFDFRNNLVRGNQALAPDASFASAVGGGTVVSLTAIGATAEGDVNLNTFWENFADLGGGGIEIGAETHRNTSGSTDGDAILTVRNSIVSENDGWGFGGTVPAGTGNRALLFSHNDIFTNSAGDFEAGILGTGTQQVGNISSDPLLDGVGVPGTCSPTVDAGVLDPNDPDFVGLEPEPNGNLVNLGHTGGTTQAITTFPDVNGDGILDGIDILRIATSFGSASSDTSRYLPAADRDQNNRVDGDDLSFVASAFGGICP